MSHFGMNWVLLVLMIAVAANAETASVSGSSFVPPGLELESDAVSGKSEAEPGRHRTSDELSSSSQASALEWNVNLDFRLDDLPFFQKRSGDDAW